MEGKSWCSVPGLSLRACGSATKFGYVSSQLNLIFDLHWRRCRLLQILSSLFRFLEGFQSRFLEINFFGS